MSKMTLSLGIDLSIASLLIHTAAIEFFPSPVFPLQAKPTGQKRSELSILTQSKGSIEFCKQQHPFKTSESRLC